MGDESIERLQALLDDSAKNAGKQLRASFEIPDRTLTARQLIRYLDKPRTIALATVSARNEPRVTPVDAVFYDAAFHVPTVSGAARLKHIARQPAVSLTHWVVDDIAIIVHGTASALDIDHADSGELDRLYPARWWTEVRARGGGVFLRVTADRMFAWAQDPAKYSA
ncbi:pyridoxamine 5'-phosphate oxidase family protein [Amycolatopsis anabasis]|uniref:pyridoxamine 5'-phosphate oxidase family protein n=1 Tax=Amycolatopsis anabasis TaxID=1840409 RepID=UPI00131B02D1|nr:pyridoxamine 5'-phosphate oxidase family protein [Amycolatopsis anabasis]